MAQDQADDARQATTDGTQPLAAPATPSAAPAAAPAAPAAAPAAPAPHRTGQLPRDWAEPSPSFFRGRRGLIVLLCAVVGSGLGVAAERLTLGSGQHAAATPQPSASPTPLTPANITSFDAKADGTGSGFRKRNDLWQAQTYTTAAFGNFKPGIGLLIDLGTAQPVTSVSFDVQTGPLTVELHAGDTAPTPASPLQRLGSSVSATGPTTLKATGGGSHRYWMIYVTQLAPADGGYTAAIGYNSITVAS